MSGIFGWSYPPGCSGPPDEYEWQPLRCKHCKSFIGGTPKIVDWKQSMNCSGECSDGMCGGPSGKHKPHIVVFDQGQSEVYTCKRCKKETKIG